MNFRYKFSIVLVILGAISAIMSLGGQRKDSVSAEEILSVLMQGKSEISADKLAEIIVEEDSSYQLVDVRPAEQYKLQSIPGARNIPISDLFNPANKPILETQNIQTIFYSSDGVLAAQAWVLAMQKSFTNVMMLKGGLAEWDSLVMKSSFEKERITAQENKLYETRYKARRLFTQWNSMPDSLKAGFFKLKQKNDKNLVGGCE